MKNNTIYILMGDMGWSGEVVLGAYSSKKAAKEASKGYAKALRNDIKTKTYDMVDVEGYYVIEKEIDSEANDLSLLRDNCTKI